MTTNSQKFFSKQPSRFVPQRMGVSHYTAALRRPSLSCGVSVIGSANFNFSIDAVFVCVSAPLLFFLLGGAALAHSLQKCFFLFIVPLRFTLDYGSTFSSFPLNAWLPCFFQSGITPAEQPIPAGSMSGLSLAPLSRTFYSSDLKFSQTSLRPRGGSAQHSQSLVVLAFQKAARYRHNHCAYLNSVAVSRPLGCARTANNSPIR
jgi:hypothetical protein